jgi:tetratricopeptide (TPR) repeat protein
MRAIVALFLLSAWSSSVASYAQTAVPPRKEPPKHRVAAPSRIPEEDRLRMKLQFHPKDAEAHKRLVELLKKKNAFRAIVTEDSVWVRNNPRDFVALVELTSYAKVALNDPALSIAELRSFLGRISREEDPEFYDNLNSQLAGELEKRGRTDQALPLFAELVRLNPDEAGFWADYGDALSALGRHDEGIQALRRSIELGPSEDTFHKVLAEALLSIGDLGSAETEYRAALSLYEAQYKKGEPTDANQSFIRQLIKTQAANHEELSVAETRLKLAHVLLLEKKYEEAIGQTKAALEADQYEFCALYLRAEILDANGDHGQAVKARDEAGSAIRKQADKEYSQNKKRPEIDPRVLFLNDKLWNERSGQPAFPSEIVSILEPRVAALSTGERVELATAYFALGRVLEAKQQWEKAIASDQTADNAVGHSNLGQELLKARAVNDALPHLRRAYELDPENLTYRIEYEQVRGDPHQK